MKSIKEISLVAKDWQIKGTEQLNGMNKAINFSNENFEELENDLKKKEDEMDAVVDRQEQYSRRNCLLVHGIGEETVEDTDKKIYNKGLMKQLNLRVLIDHTDLASLSSQKMPNLLQ